MTVIDVTNPNALTTALRDALKGFGGIMVGFGFMAESQWSMISGGIIYLVPAAYAIWKQLKMREASNARN